LGNPVISLRHLRLTLGVALAATPTVAHHSTASYDLVHGTIIQGIVTEFRWENPHVHLAVDVRGENEEIEHWSIELESPSTLRHYRWTKDTLKPGMSLSIVGGRAKNGSFNLRASYITLPDGRRLPGLAEN
jgi:hypothetical protein